MGGADRAAVLDDLAHGRTVRARLADRGDPRLAIVAADQPRADPAVLAPADFGLLKVGRDAEEHPAIAEQVGGGVAQAPAAIERPPRGAVPVFPRQVGIGRLVRAERRPRRHRIDEAQALGPVPAAFDRDRAPRGEILDLRVRHRNVVVEQQARGLAVGEQPVDRGLVGSEGGLGVGAVEEDDRARPTASRQLLQRQVAVGGARVVGKSGWLIPVCGARRMGKFPDSALRPARIVGAGQRDPGCRRGGSLKRIEVEHDLVQRVDRQRFGAASRQHWKQQTHRGLPVCVDPIRDVRPSVGQRKQQLQVRVGCALDRLEPQPVGGAGRHQIAGEACQRRVGHRQPRAAFDRQRIDRTPRIACRTVKQPLIGMLDHGHSGDGDHPARGVRARARADAVAVGEVMPVRPVERPAGDVGGRQDHGRPVLADPVGRLEADRQGRQGADRGRRRTGAIELDQAERPFRIVRVGEAAKIVIPGRPDPGGAVGLGQQRGSKAGIARQRGSRAERTQRRRDLAVGLQRQEQRHRAGRALHADQVKRISHHARRRLGGKVLPTEHPLVEPGEDRAAGFGRDEDFAGNHRGARLVALEGLPGDCPGAGGTPGVERGGVDAARARDRDADYPAVEPRIDRGLRRKPARREIARRGDHDERGQRSQRGAVELTVGADPEHLRGVTVGDHRQRPQRGPAHGEAQPHPCADFSEGLFRADIEAVELARLGAERVERLAGHRRRGDRDRFELDPGLGGRTFERLARSAIAGAADHQAERTGAARLARGARQTGAEPQAAVPADRGLFGLPRGLLQHPVAPGGELCPLDRLPVGLFGVWRGLAEPGPLDFEIAARDPRDDDRGLRRDIEQAGVAEIEVVALAVVRAGGERGETRHLFDHGRPGMGLGQRRLDRDHVAFDLGHRDVVFVGRVADPQRHAFGEPVRRIDLDLGGARADIAEQLAPHRQLVRERGGDRPGRAEDDLVPGKVGRAEIGQLAACQADRLGGLEAHRLADGRGQAGAGRRDQAVGGGIRQPEGHRDFGRGRRLAPLTHRRIEIAGLLVGNQVEPLRHFLADPRGHRKHRVEHFAGLDRIGVGTEHRGGALAQLGEQGGFAPAVERAAHRTPPSSK